MAWGQLVLTLQAQADEYSDTERESTPDEVIAFFGGR